MVIHWTDNSTKYYLNMIIITLMLNFVRTWCWLTAHYIRTHEQSITYDIVPY